MAQRNSSFPSRLSGCPWHAYSRLPWPRLSPRLPRRPAPSSPPSKRFAASKSCPRVSCGFPAPKHGRVDPGSHGGSRQHGAGGRGHTLRAATDDRRCATVEALAPGASRAARGDSEAAQKLIVSRGALWKLWKSLRDSHELPQGLLLRDTQALNRPPNRGSSSAPRLRPSGPEPNAGRSENGAWGVAKGSSFVPSTPDQGTILFPRPEKGLKNVPSDGRKPPNRGMRSRNFGDRAPGAGAGGIGASGLPHMCLRCTEVRNRGADFVGWRGSKLPLICPCRVPEGRLVPPIGRLAGREVPDPAVILPRRRGSAYRLPTRKRNAA
jgi:hypothetical protein